ncbi:MAG: DUF3365 domain-containing protein [Gracilimonas sp.]|nr:DUF3365 domain-containing protein [Gracilimonas sp.]
MKPYYFLLIVSVIVFAGFACSEKSDKSEPDITLTESEMTEYRAKGGELAGTTQKVLGSNLIKAINEGGPVNALEFCKIQAHPLTDSMATELQAHIIRVTDKPRNPDNVADQRQLEYISSAKMNLTSGEDVKPEINIIEGKITGYYPIITNQLCMQCHGSENEQINEETLAKINELYPDDQATGYGVEELRGIWVVEMDKQ